MSALELRSEKVYTPEEIGLQSPLVFGARRILMVYQGLEFPIHHIQTDREPLTIEKQVSLTQFDRAQIPVWVVYGESELGWFKGVLRPYHAEYNFDFIDISRENLEFQYYVDDPESPELGVHCGFDSQGWNKRIVTKTMRWKQPISKEEIGPSFKVYYNPAEYVAQIVFRPGG